MSTSVLSHLESKQGRLSKQVQKNAELSKILMALVTNLVNICNKRKTPISGVSFGIPYIQNHELRSKILFPGKGATRGFDYNKSDFFHYARAKNLRLAQALDENPGLDRFFALVTDCLESYARHRGHEFGEVKIGHAFIDTWDNLVLKLSF